MAPRTMPSPANFRAMLKLSSSDDSIRTFQVDQALLREFLASAEALESDGGLREGSEQCGCGGSDCGTAAVTGDVPVGSGGPDQQASVGEVVVPEGLAAEENSSSEQEELLDLGSGAEENGFAEEDCCFKNGYCWSIGPRFGARKRMRLDNWCKSPAASVDQQLLDLIWSQLDAHSLARCLYRATRAPGGSGTDYALEVSRQQHHLSLEQRNHWDPEAGAQEARLHAGNTSVNVDDRALSFVRSSLAARARGLSLAETDTGASL